MSVIIYHNPRCSKSRETLALLESRAVQPRIVKYLETPPEAEELRGLLAKLGVSARELLRRNEAPYQELGLDDASKTENELIAAMHSHPVLIQRPIVVNGNRARIGRPPEAVLEILD